RRRDRRKLDWRPSYTTRRRRAIPSSRRGRLGARRRAHLGDIVDPGLGLFFGGGADLGRLLLRELVEERIAGAGGFGDQVPFDRLLRIGGSATAAREHAREPVLRDRTAAHRGFAEQRHRAFLVLGHAGAVEQRDRVLDGGVEVVGERGRGHPPRGLALVLGYPAALLVEGRQRILGFRASGLRRGLEQLGGAREILRELLPFQVEQAEVVGRRRVAELGRRREQARRVGVVARSAAAADPEHGEREHRFAVAAVGGELVPAGGLHVVVGHA